MKIKFCTEGSKITGVKYNSENNKKVNRTFNYLTIDLPAVPYVGQKVCLAKDGMELQGTVDYVYLNWYAKGNGLTKNDEQDNLYYFVNLKNMELTDCIDDSIFEYDD